MDLSKILAISGKPGLFLIKSQGAGKLIVESIVDGKHFPAFANDKISSLEEISIFTTDEDTPLKNVFMSIHDKIGDKLDFDVKKLSPVELKEKFMLVLPNYDEDAVYQSDMKKVFQWYQLLNDKGLLDFTVEEEKKEAVAEEPVAEEKAEKKPAKKTAAKKETAKKETAKKETAKKTTTKKAAVKETAKNTTSAGTAKTVKGLKKV
ncbi:MAG: DUF5606 domain-containing protein [Bacteroidales bacterium]|nr:DUF5606 domain-containing protein [Bacteroidales bacterium]